MTDGKATERFKPYAFVLQKENLTHEQFSKKFGKESRSYFSLNIRKM